MSSVSTFRGRIIRAVLGISPATLPREANPLALDDICKRLADAEEALIVLRRRGYGNTWQSLAEVAQLVPEKRPAFDIRSLWVPRSHDG